MKLRLYVLSSEAESELSLRTLLEAECLEQLDSPPEEGALLTREADRLGIRLFRGGRSAGFVTADFSAGSIQHRKSQGPHGAGLLKRALGFRNSPYHVVDATAGWGRDAYVMWSLGCEVTAIEASPIVHAILQEGLQRANITQGFHLHLGAAESILPSLTRVDVVHLDPMYPEKKKSALSPKEMQALQCLAEPATDAELQQLWESARRAAPRVVMKRPIRDRSSWSVKPSFQVLGQTVRYDVWIGAS